MAGRGHSFECSSRFGVTTFASRYRTVWPTGGIATPARHYCAGMKKWLSRGQRREVSRVIAAPADVLYAMVSDLSRMGEWSPENVGGRWRRGSGPTVGGRFKGRNKRGLAAVDDQRRSHCRRIGPIVRVRGASGLAVELPRHLGLPLRTAERLDAGHAVPPGSPTNLVGVGRIQAAIAHQRPGRALRRRHGGDARGAGQRRPLLRTFFAESMPSPVQDVSPGRAGWTEIQLPDSTIVRSWNGFIA